jgi:cation:H+ antiporter
MGFILALVLFVVGLFAIIKGGDILVRSAWRLNEKTGINHVIIGATFVSVATTLPEVFVSIFAVLNGNHGIAVGNAFGAMITNISLILGITLAFTAATIDRREVLTKSIFLLLITATVFLFSLNLVVSWYEGVILLGAFVAFLVLNVCENKKQVGAGVEGGLPPLRGVGVTPTRHPQWRRIILGFVFGQTLLCLGAFLIVHNGEEIANIFGASETVIGFTVIAVGTSLPELTTAITSIKRKSGGLAIGNILGANVISHTLLFGICAVMGEINGTALPLSRQTAFIAIPVLFAMTLIAVLPTVFKKRVYKWQGIVSLVLYAAFIAYLFIVQPR